MAETADIENEIRSRVSYEEELRSEDPRRIVPALAGYQPEVHDSASCFVAGFA